MAVMVNGPLVVSLHSERIAAFESASEGLDSFLRMRLKVLPLESSAITILDNREIPPVTYDGANTYFLGWWDRGVERARKAKADYLAGNTREWLTGARASTGTVRGPIVIYVNNEPTSAFNHDEDADLFIHAFRYTYPVRLVPLVIVDCRQLPTARYANDKAFWSTRFPSLDGAIQDRMNRGA